MGKQERVGRNGEAGKSREKWGSEGGRRVNLGDVGRRVYLGEIKANHCYDRLFSFISLHRKSRKKRTMGRSTDHYLSKSIFLYALFQEIYITMGLFH